MVPNESCRGGRHCVDDIMMALRTRPILKRSPLFFRLKWRVSPLAASAIISRNPAFCSPQTRETTSSFGRNLSQRRPPAECRDYCKETAEVVARLCFHKLARPRFYQVALCFLCNIIAANGNVSPEGRLFCVCVCSICISPKPVQGLSL